MGVAGNAEPVQHPLHKFIRVKLGRLMESILLTFNLEEKMERETIIIIMGCIFTVYAIGFTVAAGMFIWDYWDNK